VVIVSSSGNTSTSTEALLHPSSQEQGITVFGLATSLAVLGDDACSSSEEYEQQTHAGCIKHNIYKANKKESGEKKKTDSKSPAAAGTAETSASSFTACLTRQKRKGKRI
jgi:hypothetical protein